MYPNPWMDYVTQPVLPSAGRTKKEMKLLQFAREAEFSAYCKVLDAQTKYQKKAVSSYSTWAKTGFAPLPTASGGMPMPSKEGIAVARQRRKLAAISAVAAKVGVDTGMGAAPPPPVPPIVNPTAQMVPGAAGEPRLALTQNPYQGPHYATTIAAAPSPLVPSLARPATFVAPAAPFAPAAPAPGTTIFSPFGGYGGYGGYFAPPPHPFAAAPAPTGYGGWDGYYGTVTVSSRRSSRGHGSRSGSIDAGNGVPVGNPQM